MRSAIIYSPNGPISDRLSSHRAAWARMRAHQLRLTKVYDEVVIVNKPEELRSEATKRKSDLLIYLGMEWSGALNFFGGVSEDTYQRLAEPALLHASKAFKKVFFLDASPENLAAIFHQRKDAKNFDPKRKLLAQWNTLFLEAGDMYQPEPRDFGGRVVFGDSHSLSWYPNNGAVCMRHDGQTLFGAMQRGLDNMICDWYDSSPQTILGKRIMSDIKELTVVLGNIDIRHHLLRHHSTAAKASKDPIVQGLVQHLLGDLRKKLARGAKIQIVAPLPIETESRKIPKTGWFGGTPFYGTRDQRAELAKRILGEWQDEIHVLEQPDYFFEDKHKYFLREDVMEKPQSVHISWEHSRFSREEKIL